MKFEEFLQQKHAERYKGTDDDMGEDYEGWLMDLEIEQIIQFAEEWHSNLAFGLLDRFIKFLANDVGFFANEDEAIEKYQAQYSYYEEQLDSFWKEQE